MQLAAFLEKHKEIWPTESKFWAWVRGGFRRGIWEKHPIKLEYKKANRKKMAIGVKDRLVWAAKCEKCEKWFRESQTAVDHIVPSGSLKSVDDIKEFIQRLMLISFDDIQILCNHHILSCHKIKTYAERYDMSFEKAKERKIEIYNKAKEKPKKKGVKRGKRKQSNRSRKSRARSRA